MMDDLAELLGTQEHVGLEFKRNAKDGKVIGRTICAFANDLAGIGGGDLLIGVDDDGKPVDEVDLSDRALLALTEFRDDGRILDRPSLTVRIGLFRGQKVVRVRVEGAATPPIRFQGVVYVRPGPTTRQATREDERILSERRRSRDLPFDARPVMGASIDHLNLEFFREVYLPAAVAPEILEENHRPIERHLASLGMTDPDGVPTMVGILVLGREPRRWIPGAYTQFVRYGDEGVETVINDQEINGHVMSASSRLHELFVSNSNTRIVEADGFREESRPDYPIPALREVVANALVHRNYETSNAPVRVLWFSDRVEITNPGGPFGCVRPDNFDRVTDYRNSSLAAAMRVLGQVNRFGRGISRIRTALERNGNPPPRFVVDESSWSVVVWRAA